jgi:hypothetical protein
MIREFDLIDRVASGVHKFTGFGVGGKVHG